MSAPNVPGGPGLFREKAIASIDSIERFDEAITIVSSQSVFALASIGALIVLLLGWAVFGWVPVGLQGRGTIVSGSGVQPVAASSDGTLIALPGQVGDIVREGAAVARMRTTAGEVVALRAPASGKLAERPALLGTFVRAGDPVATIEPVGASAAAIVFVPVETDRRVAPGMAVRLSPADARPDVFGFLRGHVTYAAPYPAGPERIKAALQNDAVAAGFAPEVAVREVHVALDVDEAGNLVWSGLQNAGTTISPGMPCYATIVVEERHPISLVLPQSR